MNTTNDVIGSVEFGDWLIGECEREMHRLESKNAHMRKAAMMRLGSLEQAKNLLFQFLTIQGEMMEFARMDNQNSNQPPDSEYKAQLA